MNYRPSDPPMWGHQQREFEESAHLAEYALWWEMRTGKSRVIVDTAAYQYEAGVINGVVIVAYPSAVHVNWAENEFPAYLPPRIPRKIVAWSSKRASTRAFRDDLDDLLVFPGLAVFTLNCEALTQARLLWPYLQKFCHKRKVLAVADEAQWLSTPSAKRTQRAEALARRAVSRRILTGTPVDESPFAAFAMCHFLHRGILGFTSAAAFRARYGQYEIETDDDGNPIIDDMTGLPKRAISYRFDPKTGTHREYVRQVGYQNLDELRDKLLRIGSRVLRSDCADLPEKLYRTVTFDLPPAHRHAYNKLRDRYRVELDRGEVNVLNPLVRLGRLAMLARGYWPDETIGAPCPVCEATGCEACHGTGIARVRAPREKLPGESPALATLVDEVLALDGASVAVWCRYRWDVSDCVAALTAAGRQVVRHDGSVNGEDRLIARQSFQEGTVDTFVATPATAGIGVRLDRAEALLYYSNGFSLIQRRQSEDRAEALDRRRGTLVIDLVARGTVDEHIVETLRNKRSIAEEVMGDPKIPWL